MNLTSFNFLGPIHPSFGFTYEMYNAALQNLHPRYHLARCQLGFWWGFFFTQVTEFKNKTKVQSLPDKKENFIDKVLVEDWQK